MPLIRTWSHQSVNNALDVTTLASFHKGALLALKQFMVTAGWIVQSSSNSVVANSSDNWATTADLVNAAAASPHSWVVLKSPAGFVPNGAFVYVLLAYDDGNDYDLTVQLNGATFTGGTTTANPTTIGTPAAKNNQSWLTNVLPIGARWHATGDTTGDVLFYVSLNGSGIAETAFGLGSMINALNADLFPIFGFIRRQNGADGMARTTLEGTFGLFGLWVSGNTFASSHYAGMPRDVGDTVSWLNTSGSTNGIDPTLLDMLPVTMYSQGDSSNPAAPRGQWPDIYMVKANIPVRTQTPSTGAIWTVVGGYAVPFTTLPTF